MPGNTAAEGFERKIRSFAEIRLSPLLPPDDLERLARYMIELIRYRERPPTRVGRTDWPEIVFACGLKSELTAKLKRITQNGLDAIVRWLVIHEQSFLEKPPERARNVANARPARTRSSAGKIKAREGKQAVKTTVPRSDAAEEFPTALFDRYDDPRSFQASLELQMRRFGESYYALHRAIRRDGDTFDDTTILSWLKGAKVPRSVESMDMLGRIERRYQLPDGYFKAKLPHQSRSVSGHDLGEDVSPAERRRLAWHLPDDFNRMPFAKREEILEWVRRVIITGATDYRRFQAAASKQRYAIRFPAMTYGGRVMPSLGRANPPTFDPSMDIDDPDLLSGVIDAPPRLSLEMANLITFKTTTLTAIGFQRNGVWGEETAAQKLEHLGLMFGALAASPNGDVAGRGIPLGALTFGLLIFPGIWDWYLQWRERRRGFYTAWEVDMLSIALSLTREETGWLRQHPELIERVVPVQGLVRADEIASAKRDWHASLDAFHTHARNRIKEIQRVMRVHRDPFEPIMCVLEAPSPLSEYRRITDEILLRMPDKDRYPRSAAESVRSFLMLRLGLHLGLRQKNRRQLLFCPRGHFPTSERRLEEMKRGEIRWNEREAGWEVLIPSVAFKNSNSSFFGSKPFRLILPDLLDLYRHIGAYIERHRGILLRDAKDPGTFFVKTVKQSSTDAEYNQTTFYEAWRLIIQRYGIFNPYTGRGAIKGLLPHGPHNVRDVLATHILKLTGSYEQASYAIQDTPDMIQQHYGRFLPQDKAALAARILNQVWEAA